MRRGLAPPGGGGSDTVKRVGGPCRGSLGAEPASSGRGTPVIKDIGHLVCYGTRFIE